jgi:acyl carrier protein
MRAVAVKQPPGQPPAGERAADAESALQHLIMHAWREVLGTEELGPDDDFFELGASSLDAVRIVARLEEDLSLELSVRVLLEARTIRKMARRLCELGARA